MQIYTLQVLGAIPSTRLISYSQFCDGRKQTIKTYLLAMLPKHPDGLTCREISDCSGIEIGSLTHPLLDLVDSGKLVISGVKRQEQTKRLVQIYSINQEVK